MRRFFLPFLFIVFLLISGVVIYSQTVPIPKVNFNIDTAKNPQEVGASLQILALLTVLSLAPTLLILTTAFTRIVIILSFTRTAIGANNVPPTQVLIGLSMFLTFYVMSPVYKQINEEALKPYFSKQISMEDAMKRAEPKIKNFMLKNTYQKDLALFMNLRKEKAVYRNDVSLITLIPAFIISEFKTAFVVGFYLFIPFLIIDLVVSSVLMSMGMMMLPPAVISLPAKLLVFALADGWSMLIKSLMAGYA